MARMKHAVLWFGVVIGASSFAAQAPPPGPDVVIPFQLVAKHIVIPVTIDGSAPLSFVLDTGDKYAVVDMERAKQLGVKLGAEINVGGAGAQTLKGAMAQGSMFSIPGLTGFKAPVVLAVPLGSLASRLGSDFDGIVGTDFITQFVVEIDYKATRLVLHDKSAFHYDGSGVSVPMKLDSAGHPTIAASVTPVGGVAIAGTFIVDFGSGLPLALYSPFAAAHQLPGPTAKTMPAIGTAGAGGEAAGLMGRVEAITIGPHSVKTPITLFSTDKTGAFANAELSGNIGEPVLSYFKVFLDYSHDRLIFEPSRSFDVPYDRAYSGLVIESEGADHKTFRVTNILEHSPAADLSMQKNDVITAIDGRAASTLTLTELMDLFEKPVSYKVTIRRGDETLTVTLTPRRLI